jgi:hypothetical protein
MMKSVTDECGAPAQRMVRRGNLLRAWGTAIRVLYCCWVVSWPGVVGRPALVEQQLCPRPRIELPEELAFLEMDRCFASTGFHARDDRSVDRARRPPPRR